jgi:hypothetical protein
MVTEDVVSGELELLGRISSVEVKLEVVAPDEPVVVEEGSGVRVSDAT